MAERRDKGLCYNCDEKFHINHSCKGKTYILIMEEDPNEPLIDDTSLSLDIENSLDSSTANPSSAISYHALTGQYSPQTLFLQGLIHSTSVQVLIDSGSTHNFLQERLAKHIGIVIQPAPHFTVIDGNGEALHCSGKCPNM